MLANRGYGAGSRATPSRFEGQTSQDGGRFVLSRMVDGPAKRWNRSPHPCRGPRSCWFSLGSWERDRKGSLRSPVFASRFEGSPSLPATETEKNRLGGKAGIQGDVLEAMLTAQRARERLASFGGGKSLSDGWKTVASRESLGVTRAFRPDGCYRWAVLLAIPALNRSPEPSALGRESR